MLALQPLIKTSARPASTALALACRWIARLVLTVCRLVPLAVPTVIHVPLVFGAIQQAWRLFRLLIAMRATTANPLRHQSRSNNAKRVTCALREPTPRSGARPGLISLQLASQLALTAQLRRIAMAWTQPTSRPAQEAIIVR